MCSISLQTVQCAYLWQFLQSWHGLHSLHPRHQAERFCVVCYSRLSHSHRNIFISFLWYSFWRAFHLLFSNMDSWTAMYVRTLSSDLTQNGLYVYALYVKWQSCYGRDGGDGGSDDHSDAYETWTITMKLACFPISPRIVPSKPKNHLHVLQSVASCQVLQSRSFSVVKNVVGNRLKCWPASFNITPLMRARLLSSWHYHLHSIQPRTSSSYHHSHRHHGCHCHGDSDGTRKLTWPCHRRHFCRSVTTV